MLYLTCTTITSVDLAHYGVSRAKDWVSVYCGTRTSKHYEIDQTILGKTKQMSPVYKTVTELDMVKFGIG